MAKIIRGTRDAKGTVTLRGGQGGLRKVRCQSCHGTAVETVQANGQTVYTCACGARYTSKPM